MFAAVSGDNNAIHTNEEFAASTVFGGRIAHGMLTASVISATIAGRLPGPGAVYLEQKLSFTAPVRAGDTVHAKVTVKEIIAARGRAMLETTCTVRGTVVVAGEALVRVGSAARRAALAEAA